MPPFAKLFGPDEDQILVKLDTASDSDTPEIRVYFQPPGLGVCSFALGFRESEDCWDRAEAAFMKMDEAAARHGVAAAMQSFHTDLAQPMPGTAQAGMAAS